MMNVIFGGAFNPPTIAHHEIAKHMCSLAFVSKIIFIPVGDHYKKPDLIPAHHRYEMLKIISKYLPKATVSDLEIGAKRVLKTIETLEILQKKQPHEEFAFLMGADNLSKLTKWHNYRSLIKNFKMLILDRGELDVNSIIDEHFGFAKDNFIVINSFEKMNISSTTYRNNSSKSEILLPEVEAYIKKHGLYRREND